MLTFAGLPVWAPVLAIGVAGMAPVIHSLAIYKHLERRGAV